MNKARQLHRILEKLEDRVLFDAVPDGGFLIQAEEPLDTPVQNQQQVETTSDLRQQSQARELIVIDANVQNADELINEILGSRDNADQLFEIQLLSADEDGIEQISAILDRAESPYEAVHILSHGNAGMVQLGSSLITSDTLTDYAGSIAGWTSGLSSDADLMFYGCNLSASESGLEFIEMMSVLSGADVAASNDITGHTDLDGNWELETRIGEIQADALALQGFQGAFLVTDNGFEIGTETFGNLNEFSVVPEGQTGASSRLYEDVATAANGTINIDVQITLVDTFDENGNVTTGTADQLPVTLSDFTGGPILLARTVGGSVNGFEGHTAEFRIEYLDGDTGAPLVVVGEFTIKDIDYEDPTQNGSGSEAILVDGSQLDLYETSTNPPTDVSFIDNGDGTLTFTNFTSNGSEFDEERWVNLQFEPLQSVNLTLTARNANTGYGLSTDVFSTQPSSNNTPDATDDNFTTIAGSSVGGNIVTQDNGNGVDSDPEGDPLTVVAINGNANGVGNPVAGSDGGTFTVGSDGVLSFDSGNDFDFLAVGETATTTISYTITDGLGLDDQATVTVTVVGVNNAPENVGTIPPQNNVDDQTIPNLDISAFFSDPDTTDTLTFSAGGTLPPGLAINPNTGIISGTLDNSASQSGPFTVVIVANDGNGGTTQQSFTWNVTNPGPTATDDEVAVNENELAAGNVITENLGNGTDSDPDGDSLTVSQVDGSNANVGVSVAGNNGGQFTINSDGSYDFDPGNDFDSLAVGQTTTTQVTYTITDSEGGTDTATVTVTVTGTNDDPTSLTIPNQSGIDSTTSATLNISSFFSDPDNDSLTFSAGGTLPPGLTLDPNTGLITGTYDSSASQGGPYSVTITADDGNGGTTQQTFAWNVTNPGPTAGNDNYTTDEDTPVSGDVTGNDSDPDGDSLEYSQTSNPGNGSVVFNDDGTFTYTPIANFFGSDSFTYEVVDADGAIASATVDIVVDPINDLPVVNPSPDQTNVDSENISLDISGNFSDPDGDPLTFTAAGLPPGLSIDSAGNISGTLDSSASQGGPYAVQVTADDGNGGTVTDTFMWTVTNPGPTAGGDTFSTSEDTPVSGDVSGNDSDPDGDSLIYSQTSNPSNGTVVVFNTDGTFDYTPDPGFFGTDSFDYEVIDADGAIAIATVTINVGSVNDQPVVNPVPDQSNVDSESISLDISGNFSDPDGDPLTFTATGLPLGLSINSAGNITGTLDSSASQGGPYTVQVTADDGNGGTVTDTFTWTVTNPGPIATDDNFTTNEDTVVDADVSSNDNDSDGDNLTFIQTSNPTNGTVIFGTDGSFSYTPGTDFFGTDSFNYEVIDADGAIATATVTITVDPVNDLPVASPIPDQTNVDSENISLDVSGNFSDPEGDSLTFTATGLPLGLSIDSAGNITGTLDSSASQGGPYTVQVTADDGNGGTVTDTFTWNVTNPGPIAGNDNYTTDEDMPVSGDVTGNDSDPDGDSLVYSQTSNPSNGSVVFNNDGTFDYTPATGFFGTDSFDYEVVDADGSIATATVTINIGSVNDLPQVDSPIPDQSDQDSEVVSLDISGNFSDPDGDPLTFAATGLPPGLSIDPAGNITGTLDSSASQGGPYTVQITADDDNGGTITDTFSWNVTNPAPNAVDDNFTTTEDSPLTASAATNDNDIDGDSLTYSQTSNPTNGSVVLFNSDGSFTYTPDPNFSGTDSFTYEVVDADGATSTATIEIVVNSQNDAPVATTISDQADTDADNISLDITGNFSDPDGDSLTFSATGLPTGLSIDPMTGLITGTLDSSASQGGPYTVQITADDGNGGFVTEEFTWTVVNPGPIATNDNFSTNEDTSVAGDVSGNDSDTDGDSLTFNRITNPVNGSVVFNNDGTFVYTPTSNFAGTDTFQYEIVDADGATSTAMVLIVVDAVNDAPQVDTVVPDQFHLDGQSVSLDLSNNFSDPEGDPITFTATGLPPGLSIDPSGIISGTLDTSASQGGPYTVTLTADDGNGSVQEVFTWVVSNPGPLATDDGFVTNEDTSVSGDVSNNDSDPDGDNLVYNQTSNPANGTVVWNNDGSFTYTPTADFSGTDSFTYEVVDADGATSTATVTITISAVNDAPVVDTIIPDQSDLDSNTVTLDVSSNFSDPEGDGLTFSATNLPPGLSIEPATGLITGTLDSSASQGGPYSVTIIASDGNGGTTTDTFTWTVVNPVPVAQDDSFTTNEDTPFVGTVANNDNDSDGDNLVYNQTSNPTDGTVVWNNDGTFEYTPNADFTGTDTFTYEVVDADGAVSTAVVTIAIDPVNDIPTSTVIPDQNNIDSESVSVDFSGNFSDPENDPLTFTATGLPSGLSIDPNTGLVSGTLDSSASQGGPYTVSVTADDGNGGTVTESFTWNVTNPAPSAVNDSFSTTEDTPVAGDASTNDSDPDGDARTYNLLSNPTNGTLIWNNGTFEYTPNTNFSGIDSFDYETVDADGAVATATVTIAVGQVNDPPVVSAAIPDQADQDGDTVSLDISTNFSDADGNALSFSATGLPTGLTLDSTTGLISGTLDNSASQSGPYIVVVTANDGNGASVADTFLWTVTNPGPTATDNAGEVTEDTQLTTVGNVISDDDGNGTDADPDLDNLTVNAVTVNGTHGTLQVNPDGTYTYTLDNNDPAVQGLDIGETLTESFSYTVSDGEGGVASANIVITINGTNDAPIPSAVPNQVDQDTDVVSLQTSNFFSDVDDTNLAYSVTGLPTGLSIDPATGEISGTLDSSASQGGPNADGIYTVFVTAEDDNGEFAVNSFTWTVTNPGPIAVDDNFATNEDTPLNGSVDVNDSDPDGDTLVYQQLSNATNGSVTFNNGAFTYTPVADFHGTDSFTYEVIDADGAVATATVTINVNSVNDLPTVNSITDQTDQDGDSVLLNLSTNFSDPEGEPLTFTSTNLPPGLSIDPNTGVVSGTIDTSASQGGPYNVTVTAEDPSGGTVTDTFTWTVTNPGPIAVNDSFSTNEDTPFSDSVAGNDSDPDGDVLTFSLVTPAVNGMVTLDPDGSFDYSPVAGFNGLDSFEYQITDADGATAIATAFVNIGAVNDLPVVTALADQVDLDGQPVSVDAGSNFSDPDGDSLTFSATGLPPGLSIDSASGVISGTLDTSASQGGPYTVVVTGNDGNGGFVSDTFTWTVTNPGPVAGNDNFTTSEDTPVSGSVIGNDSDPDGDATTFTQVSDPANGTLIWNDGSFTYTPAPQFSGTDSFQYQIVDADGATSLATVTINVSGTNDTPEANPLPDQNSFDGDPVMLDLSPNFTDVDGDPLTFTAIGLPPGLTINLNTGIISGMIDPSASQGGPYTVEITAVDGSGASVSETLTWNIENPGPSAADDNFVTNEDTTVTGNVDGNDSDPDGDPVTFIVTSNPNNGTVLLNPGGFFSYSPDPDFFGTDSFTYEIVDADGATASATVTIDVNPVDDAPVNTSGQPLPDLTSNDNEPISLDLGGPFVDPEGDPLTFTSTNLPPGLSIDPNTGVVSGTIDPSASQGGPYAVTVEVSDPNGNTTTETFIWTVENPAPVVINDTQTTTIDTTYTGTVANLVSDPDGDPLVYSISNGPTNGNVQLNPDGTYSYTPDPQFVGVDQFTFTVIDIDGSSTTGIVTIEIGNIFGFDAFTNEADRETNRLVDRYTEGIRQVLLSERIDVLAREPIVAGYAAPGTILVARLYSEDGSIIGEMSSQADQAGNFVINFAGTPETRNARVVVEQIATEAVALGQANFSLTEDTYRSMQLESAQKPASTIGSILSDLPSKTLDQLHQHNNNPLNLL